MKLSNAVLSYVALKRSLGAVYDTELRVLRSFTRATGDITVQAIEPRTACNFCRGSGPPPRSWPVKHHVLQGFFRHLVARGHLASSPLPEPPPRIRSSFEPHIYSLSELRQLLDATEILADDRRPLRPETYRTLLLLLYAAGLRTGEGLRLRLCDTDLARRVLTIWNTKFSKSRLVPIGTSLTVALRTYRQARLQLPRPGGDRSFLFPSGGGGALPYHQLRAAFVRLREHVGIVHPPDARWQPRLHDLRHTFAVHRLVAWYREDADVQARLPWLATYLGHVGLAGTQAYLTMTPELLTEASRRFQRYAALGELGDAG